MSYQTLHKCEIMSQLGEIMDGLISIRLKVDESNRILVRSIGEEVNDLMERIAPDTQE